MQTYADADTPYFDSNIKHAQVPTGKKSETFTCRGGSYWITANQYND